MMSRAVVVNGAQLVSYSQAKQMILKSQEIFRARCIDFSSISIELKFRKINELNTFSLNCTPRSTLNIDFSTIAFENNRFISGLPKKKMRGSG